MILFLKEQIKDGFDQAMDTFVNTGDYKAHKWEVEKVFLDLRSKLPPELAKDLNGLMNARDDLEAELACEAYYRGVVHGVALLDDVK